nr:protein TIC 62, chloroplastic [Ipomoea batatas]
MELYSLQSIAVTKIPRRSFAEKPFLCGQTVKPLPCNTVKRCPDSRKLKFIDFRAQASGTTKFSSVAPESKDVNLKDGNVVFVAGATGRVGSRTVRELLKLGFQVRAGVRSIQRAEPLVKSVKQMKLDNVADGGTSPIERLEIVECDLEKSKIVPALGNASTVICCIGASEKEVFDITGPYRIDYQATKNLIDAATTAKVGHFILLTSLGTNKFGFPAAILNLFWGVLCWKRRAEEALLASGLPYTIVRPGGMERPTDTYKETHNITLSQEDTLFGGQVSNLQVSAVTIPKITSTPTEKESTPAIAIEAKPLSPYTAYADLKPPTSPTPSPPSIVDKVSLPSEASKTTETIDPNLAKVEVQKTTPLSPYTAYEDLKPPTSPIPTQSRSKAASTTAEAQVQLNVPTNGPPTVSASRHSPYLVYDDLKPPTSPTPSTPTVSQIKTAQSPAAEKPEGTLHVNASKERPLSPYTVYEDLKPPTSPSPSSPKL